MRIIQTYTQTGRVPNVVNLAPQDAGDARPGRRATRTGPACSRTCSTGCARPGINVEETENIIFADAEAAVARISLDGEPSADVVAAIKCGNPHVLDVHVVAVATSAA